MAYEIRMPQDYRFGQLSAGISSLDTTLTSPAFAGLPSSPSTGQYIPLTLADDSVGLYETVWVTAHSAGSSTITVVRAREGTSARAWANGTTWRCAPTLRDTLQTFTRATLPADAHYGMRAQLTDEAGLVVERTAVGWAGTVSGGLTGRSHGWRWQPGNIAHDLEVQVTAAVADAQYGGNIATYTGGNFFLNKAGLWSLVWYVYTDHNGNGKIFNFPRWVGGPPAAIIALTDQRQRLISSPSNGQTVQSNNWVGYVTPSQAAAALKLILYQTNTASAGIYVDTYLTAEYLGG